MEEYSIEIKHVANVLKEIGNTSSRKEKTEIIYKNKDFSLLIDVIHFIFNPYIKTNIAKKKLSKKVDSKDVYSITDIYGYMDYLKECSGKDSDIASVQSYIDSQPDDVRWLLESMATKTLKIGVTGKTINDALGYQLIPQFNVMLAEQYIKVKPDGNLVYNWKHLEGKDVIITQKLDGNRAVMFLRDDGSVKIYSREGHSLEGFTEIEEEAKKLSVTGIVLDGEMIAVNNNSLNALDLFQETSSIMKKKGIKTGIEFHVFDALPIRDFEKGICNTLTYNRKYYAKKLIEKYDCKLIKNVDILYHGKFDIDVVNKFSEEAFSRQEEGVMIQVSDAPYECKRTKNIQKIKSINSCDVLCVDMYEGKTGENIGRLGGIVVDYRGNRVNVGSGFKSDDRDAYWENPCLIIGKIVEIQYTEEFIGANGKLDLRFARFKTIRHDKTEPSYN